MGRGTEPVSSCLDAAAAAVPPPRPQRPIYPLLQERLKTLPNPLSRLIPHAGDVVEELRVPQSGTTASSGPSGCSIVVDGLIVTSSTSFLPLLALFSTSVHALLCWRCCIARERWKSSSSSGSRRGWQSGRARWKDLHGRRWRVTSVAARTLWHSCRLLVKIVAAVLETLCEAEGARMNRQRQSQLPCSKTRRESRQEK